MLLMFLFEGFFIFELYETDWFRSTLKEQVPSAAEPMSPGDVPAEAPRGGPAG